MPADLAIPKWLAGAACKKSGLPLTGGASPGSLENGAERALRHSGVGARTLPFVTKLPSKPAPADEGGAHDPETSTIIAKASPALLRAAGGRPAIPRPDPNKPKKPAEPARRPSPPEPEPPPLELALELDLSPPAAPVAPSRPPVASSKPPAAVPPPPTPSMTPDAAEISFADLDDGNKDRTLAVRGFVLPRGALPNEGRMPSPLGSQYEMDAVRVPTFPPQPEAYSSVPPAPIAKPPTYPSDITRIAVNVSEPPPAPPSSSAPPPSSSRSDSGPPSSRARAVAASIESPRTKVPTLLVDRTTLLAARAVNKRESIVLACVDGVQDVDTIAGETGFLPSETVEIVVALVARGILAVK